VMSALALAGGAVIYWLLRRQYDLHLHVPVRYTGRLLFQHSYDRFIALTGRLTNRLENGSLQRYLALAIGTFTVLGAWPFIEHGFDAGGTAWSGPGPLGLVVWGAAMTGALGAVWSHHARAVAIILAGVVGLTVSITFAYFSAPDLALTQLAVEVVTTLVLLMALALLPASTPRESGPWRVARDAALAVAAGIGVGALSWAVLTREQATIAWYFLENSLPRGGGHNIVNVLLVDFRGFDTFGEIIVLSMAAIGVWMLTAGLREELPAFKPVPAMDRLMFAVAARIVFPFALLVSVYLFFRGHNMPGGGFLAGLIAALGLVMQYMGGGLSPMFARVRIDFAMLAGAGVLIAGLTGLASVVAGAPFLTSASGHVHLPFVGEIPVASAMVFDLGVFLTVLSATLLTLITLGHARRKSPAMHEEP
ncbi:MAG TPA: hydrogen gas-evolving membrane-bound hydrogenase subunit E, partial [Nitrospiraceae bacterium]|nr:hydrogen gas-evolving membrane-bound hydrogenase subunit E [Nitrospiraceae bacterium]